MILSDRDIEAAIQQGHIVIEPYDPDELQPASYDIRLGDQLRLPDAAGTSKLVTFEEYELKPQEFVLGTTVERIQVPDFLVGRIEGKSSLGRMGLSIHTTAGFIDPGFRGPLTLEIYNHSQVPITLRAGQHIGQLSFTQLTSPARRPYGSTGLGSHYQDQVGPTASWIN